MWLSIIIGEGIEICTDQLIIILFLFFVSCLGSLSHDYLNEKNNISIFRVALTAFPSTLFTLLLSEKITSIGVLSSSCIAYFIGFVSLSILSRLDNYENSIKFIKDLINFIINK